MNKKNKLIGFVFIAFITITGFSVGFTSMINYHLKKIYYDKTAQLIATAVTINPQAEEQLVSALKKKDLDKIKHGSELLLRYGYGKEGHGFVDEKLIAIQVVLGSVVLIALLFICFIAIGLWLYNKNLHRITGLTQYLYSTNEGNYILKAQNLEDEFSILEDEIYKTVLMLREGRETAKQEKLNLAANLADISHQIKTPLTSISMMLELIEEPRQNSEDSIYFDKISIQMDRLNQLVTALLNISKLDAGTLTLERKAVNVYELLNHAIEPLIVFIQKKRLNLLLQEDLEVTFTGDFYWSSEALLNIIKNCVEHTQQQGSITITYQHNPVYTSIIIEDNGEGFDKEDIPYVFNRFYKGKNASNESVGIGLALAKSIIVSQNGEVCAENSKVGGAKFTIKFYKK